MQKIRFVSKTVLLEFTNDYYWKVMDRVLHAYLDGERRLSGLLVSAEVLLLLLRKNRFCIGCDADMHEYISIYKIHGLSKVVVRTSSRPYSLVFARRYLSMTGRCRHHTKPVTQEVQCQVWRAIDLVEKEVGCFGNRSCSVSRFASASDVKTLMCGLVVHVSSDVI